MDHLRDVSIIVDHPDMDKLLQAEPESVIDDLLLFPLTPEDTDPLIQVILELPPQWKYPVCTRHPPNRYRDTVHV